MPHNANLQKSSVHSFAPPHVVDKAVSDFLSNAQQHHNETQRKELFIVLLTQLFPNHSSQIQRFASGAERYVKVERPAAGITGRGFIDTFFGNLVIEFEHDLEKMLETAKSQLQGYISTLWSDPNNYRAYLAVATDGITWRVYSPRLLEPDQLPLKPSNIELRFIEGFDARKVSASDLYLWLDRILFRDNSLVPTSSEVCRDFGTKSHSFSFGAKLIADKLNLGLENSEIRASFDSWEHYLKYTYGEVSGGRELFIKHTYLSSFTKLLMGNVLAAKRGQELGIDDIGAILEGSFFQRLNIKNYVERDFFHWVGFRDLGLESLWVSIFHSLRTYDFTQINSDFLKGIYQDLVDPVDRHDLGEYYTPDWLCEKIVDEYLVLSKTGTLPRVADITCGSGSFLRAAINRSKSLLKKSSPAACLEAILATVSGFEIHPLAVFTAKTNYILSLGDLVNGSQNPVTIPIYLCDSLLSPELSKPKSPGAKELELRLGDDRVSIPWEMAVSSEIFDALIDYADRLAHSSATGDISPQEIATGIRSFIKKTYSGRLTNEEAAAAALVDIVDHLTEKIRSRKNSIWSYVLKNNYRPVFMANQFDLIVGNPPWLSYRYISDPAYKSEIEYLAVEKYGIAPQSSELRTQMELATVFLAHAVSKYLTSDGSLAFVMPRSLFSADHHARLRDKTHLVEMRIEEFWDLEGTGPLFNVPTCVVVAKRGTPTPEKSFKGRVIEASLPRQDLHLVEASGYLVETNGVTLHVATMGGRSALSRDVVQLAAGDHYYQDLFRQGADLMPRSFYFVEVTGNPIGSGTVPAKSHPVVRATAKDPWREINLQGLIDRKQLFRTCIADNVLPFAVQAPYWVHLPIENDSNSGWQTAKPKELELRGYIESARWFREASSQYEDHKTEKAKSLVEMLNYNNKLLCQNPESKYWVLFCSSGKNVCAAAYENNHLFWADQKTYWYCPDTEGEAHYLAGILNAPSLNEIIKPFQSKGLLGERDIHKKILDVGIPRFSPDCDEISELANHSKAIALAAKSLVDGGITGSLAKRRAVIRQELADQFLELDELVKAVFDAQDA